jgi:hypothetical protein
VPGLQLRRRVPSRSTGPAPRSHLEAVVSGDNYHGSNDRSNREDLPPELGMGGFDWVAWLFAVVFVALVIFGILFVRA